jgi:hypothetical protein
MPLERCFQDLSNGMLHAQNCQILSLQTEKQSYEPVIIEWSGPTLPLGGNNMPLERCFQDLSNSILHAQNCQILSLQTEKQSCEPVIIEWSGPMLPLGGVKYAIRKVLSRPFQRYITRPKLPNIGFANRKTVLQGVEGKKDIVNHPGKF